MIRTLYGWFAENLWIYTIALAFLAGVALVQWIRYYRLYDQATRALNLRSAIKAERADATNEDLHPYAAHDLYAALSRIDTTVYGCEAEREQARRDARARLRRTFGA
jgi:hypothetical protein